MMCEMTKEQVAMAVLEVTGKWECCEHVWWRTDGEYAPITMLVNFNDLFAPSCADAEEITAANVGTFIGAYTECSYAAEGGEGWAHYLFCCRVRKQSPKRAWREGIPSELHDLFFREW